MVEGLDPKFRWYRIKLIGMDRKLTDYYFRGITQKELRIAQKKEDKSRWEAENYILENTVHNSVDWPNMWEGVALKLLEQIFHFSGLDDDLLTYREANDWLDGNIGKLEAAAVAMIPSCTPEYLENCDPFIYAKLINLGRIQFESTWGVKVEQAWGGGGKAGQSGVKVDLADRTQIDASRGQSVGTDTMTMSWNTNDPIILGQEDPRFFGTEE